MFPQMAACSATLHLGVCPQGCDHIKPQFVSMVKAGLNYMHVTKGGSLCLWDAVFARGFKQRVVERTRAFRPRFRRENKSLPSKVRRENKSLPSKVRRENKSLPSKGLASRE
uniref:Uncharacterized protein n=1 Tax=Timema douglasi TaxID=61478 RepID=A0A7R8VTD7_TIMDO|nr:unnamed protein product [Timema douglasi]